MTLSTTRPRHFPLTFLTLALATALSADAAAAQSTSDEEAVRTVVTTLFDAMAARDTAAMSALFAPDARFAGLGREGVSYTTPAEFLSAVAGATGPAWIERTYDTDVKIDGPLASVWTYYTLHVGEQFSHCGYDAFQMLKIDGTWKIVHLADSRRRDGCSRTDASG